MITISETKNQMLQEPRHWRIPLMDFVDDFRYYKDLKAVEKGIELSHPKFDALLASTVEYLCREMSLPIPSWVHAIAPVADPWFVSGLENLKAIALAESPVAFRIRKIFVLENFLHRV
jgi:hypothetical protein